MVGSIGPISAVGGVRQARGAVASAPIERPVRKGDWVDISNVGQASFETPALNQAAAKKLAAGDSALWEVAGILGDVGELVSQGDDDSSDEAGSRQLKIDASIASVDRVAGTTVVDGKPLLDGTAVIEAGGEKIALPAVDSSSMGVGEYRLGDLRMGGGLAVGSGKVEVASSVVAAAIARIASARAEIAGFKSQARAGGSGAGTADQMAGVMESVRRMLLAGGGGAVGEGNRKAIVQMLK